MRVCSAPSGERRIFKPTSWADCGWMRASISIALPPAPSRTTSWLAASGVAVVSVLLGLELLRGTEGSVPRTWLYGAVVGLLMSQATLAVSLWNVSDTVGTLVLLLVFYLLSGLAHHALWDRVTKRVAVEYAVTTIAALAALWFYANWST